MLDAVDSRATPVSSLMSAHDYYSRQTTQELVTPYAGRLSLMRHQPKLLLSAGGLLLAGSLTCASSGFDVSCGVSCGVSCAGLRAP
jgi:hypothetical protein